MANNNNQDKNSVNNNNQDINAKKEFNQQTFLAQFYKARKDNLDNALMHIMEADLLLTLEYFLFVLLKALFETILIELFNWGLTLDFKFSLY